MMLLLLLLTCNTLKLEEEEWLLDDRGRGDGSCRPSSSSSSRSSDCEEATRASDGDFAVVAASSWWWSPNLQVSFEITFIEEMEEPLAEEGEGLSLLLCSTTWSFRSAALMVNPWEDTFLSPPSDALMRQHFSPAVVVPLVLLLSSSLADVTPIFLLLQPPSFKEYPIIIWYNSNITIHRVMNRQMSDIGLSLSLFRGVVLDCSHQKYY